jgi:hypothetical protein
MELYFHSLMHLYSVVLHLLEKDNFPVCGAAENVTGVKMAERK